MLRRVVCCYVSDHAVHDVAIGNPRLRSTKLLGQKVREGTMVGALGVVLESVLLGCGSSNKGKLRDRLRIRFSQAARCSDRIRGQWRRHAHVGRNRTDPRASDQRAGMAAIQNKGEVFGLRGKLKQKRM